MIRHVASLVIDAQFVTPSPYLRQRPRNRHIQGFTALQKSKIEPCFKSGFSRERRCLDLSMEPDQWLVTGIHQRKAYVILDISSIFSGGVGSSDSTWCCPTSSFCHVVQQSGELCRRIALPCSCSQTNMLHHDDAGDCSNSLFDAPS